MEYLTDEDKFDRRNDTCVVVQRSPENRIPRYCGVHLQDGLNLPFEHLRWEIGATQPRRELFSSRLCTIRQILDTQDQLCEVSEGRAPPAIPFEVLCKAIPDEIRVEGCDPIGVGRRDGSEFLCK